jgi:outer membrane protein assembly factor BamB
VVANNLVYVNSYSENTYALEAYDGIAVWQGTTGGTEYASPVVNDGTVLVAAEDDSLYDFAPASTPKTATHTRRGPAHPHPNMQLNPR